MPSDDRDADAPPADAAGWYIDFDGDEALDLDALKADAAGRREAGTRTPAPTKAAGRAGPWLGDLLDAAADEPGSPVARDPRTGTAPTPRPRPPAKRARRTGGAVPASARSDDRSSERPVAAASAQPPSDHTPVNDERPSPRAGDGSAIAACEVVGPPGPQQRMPAGDWGRPHSRVLGASVLAACLTCGVLTAAKVQLTLGGYGSGTVTPHRAALAASDDQERNTRLARVTMPEASDTEDVGAVRWTEPPTPRMAAVLVEPAVAQPEAVGPIGPARTVEQIDSPDVVSGLHPDRAAQPQGPVLAARTLSPHEMAPLTAAPTVLARTEPMQEPADVIAAIARPVTSVPPDPVAKAPTRLASPAAGTVGSTHRSHARAALPVARVEPLPVRNAGPPRATVERPRSDRVAAHARIGVRRTAAIAPVQTPRPVRPSTRDVAHAEGIGGIALPASLRPTPF